MKYVIEDTCHFPSPLKFSDKPSFPDRNQMAIIIDLWYDFCQKKAKLIMNYCDLPQVGQILE